jgi:hypothetical protein
VTGRVERYGVAVHLAPLPEGKGERRHEALAVGTQPGGARAGEDRGVAADVIGVRVRHEADGARLARVHPQADLREPETTLIGDVHRRILAAAGSPWPAKLLRKEGSVGRS